MKRKERKSNKICAKDSSRIGKKLESEETFEGLNCALFFSRIHCNYICTFFVAFKVGN